MNLDGLNNMQKKAVKHTEGPLLIIAGAGSGKTRVLTHRIAYLIEECGVKPYNILAITFTNKAAAEMKERVEKIVDCGSSVWVSTFHSTCVRILRRYIDRLGYDLNFTIYDTDDQKSVIKEACKKLNIDTKMLKERTIMSVISSAKDEMITPDEMEMNAGADYTRKRIAGVYREYQKLLKMNNALDFDDLICKTVELFNTDEEILEAYRERFKYIMVDEYQDTNMVQFKLISKLAGKYGNLCVVGDDDQSIYKFRGADIGNILNFESTFANTEVIKLEQNYRSTQTILNAANSVIKNNLGRKEKELWTDNGIGDKIEFSLYEDAYKEAEGVVEGISAKVRDGWNYNDVAILYRTNAQSRMLEEKLIMRNIPYRIYGGVNFYQRKEIKDILAYLKTIDNGMDSQAVKRIINVPKRGIGATTIERIQEFADNNDMTFWDALVNAEHIPNIGRAYAKLEAFVTMIFAFKAKLEFMSIKDLTENIIKDIGYIDYLLESESKDEVEVRQQNIDEFINKIVTYEQTAADVDNEQAGDIGSVSETVDNDIEGQLSESENGRQNKPTLCGFLSEVALVADIDNLDQNGNQVMLMTLHSAKGLEFPIVYMTGLEDGLFPSYMTIVSDDPTDIEEERRLCYVGITRAQKELSVTAAKQRMIRGETQINKVSRFVNEIPKELMHINNRSTGYNKSKIAFGNEEASSGEIKYDFRANAKKILSAYGSGNADSYAQPNRVKITGNNSADRKSSYLSGYGRTDYGTATQSSNYGRTGYGTTVQSSDYGRTGYGTTAQSSDYGRTGYGTTAQSSDYGTIRDVSKARPNKSVGFGKEFPSKNAFSKTGRAESVLDGPGYNVGDTVNHVKFGNGIVKAIQNSTKDYMVTVEFDDYGTKKMLAGFANLKKQ